MGSPAPTSKAACDATVGGSWHWSPTRTSCWHPRQSGTREADSVTCEASSSSTPAKVMPSSWSEPTPTHVEQTTCALRIADIFSDQLISDRPGGGTSTQYCMSSGRMRSGRPSRTARTPERIRPSRRLSTAMLESEVASTGPPPPPPAVPERTHQTRTRSAVCVLPVPGGPWIRVSRWVTASSTACAWLRFRPTVAGLPEGGLTRGYPLGERAGLAHTSRTGCPA
mmetsp:Transcript_25158/g.66847  ORF Transcript_25158/g.66847 Transcript_25158/m.66847 type:complete len:225 (+) Transcript_25158:781-1455(+)